MNWFERIQNRLREPLPRGGDSTGTASEFTPRAQQVIALARTVADRFHHNFVGTEHLLLGLIKLGQGVAVNVLQRMGLDLERVRAEVEKQVGNGPDQKILGYVPYTPRVKKVLALATKEARALNHTYVGTEHLLLGLLREGDGVAARVLKSLAVDIEQAREEVLKELDPNFSAQEFETATSAGRQTSTLPSLVELRPEPESQAPTSEAVDTSKRYDVSCAEQNQQVIVYRNVLFRGARELLPGSTHGVPARFIELEDADGKTVFVASSRIIKFWPHGGAAPTDQTFPAKSSE